jgi:hypothetical protein
MFIAIKNNKDFTSFDSIIIHFSECIQTKLQNKTTAFESN